MLGEAECSFAFPATFRSTDEEGGKINVVGRSAGSSETQFRLVYLIKWQKYLQKMKVLQKLVLK